LQQGGEQPRRGAGFIRILGAVITICLEPGGKTLKRFVVFPGKHMWVAADIDVYVVSQGRTIDEAIHTMLMTHKARDIGIAQGKNVVSRSTPQKYIDMYEDGAEVKKRGDLIQLESDLKLANDDIRGKEIVRSARQRIEQILGKMNETFSSF